MSRRLAYLSITVSQSQQGYECVLTSRRKWVFDHRLPKSRELGMKRPPPCAHRARFAVPQIRQQSIYANQILNVGFGGTLRACFAKVSPQGTEGVKLFSCQPVSCPHYSLDDERV